MIRGFFSDIRLSLLKPIKVANVMPYVWALIYLEALDRRAWVPFLLDTGADLTVLHPQDSSRLYTPEQGASFANPISVGGIGGGDTYYEIDALTIFIHHDGRFETFNDSIYVARPSRHNAAFNSLLGRDLLKHFSIHYDQAGENLTLGT